MESAFMGSICQQPTIWGKQAYGGRLWCELAAGAPVPWWRARKPRFQVTAGIHVDRRSYFERVLKRQLELEAREAEALRSCPLECVREVLTLNEFDNVLLEAEQTNKLVMVDFYSSSCGACKYLLPQVIHLCKKGCEDSCSLEDSWGLIYLKHNVRDDYDELTDLARFYAIRAVPSFIFFLNGSPIKHLSTRDKECLQEAVCHVYGWFLEQQK